MQQNNYNNHQYSPHNNAYQNMLFNQDFNNNNNQTANINQFYSNRQNSLPNGQNMLNNFYNNQHLNGTAIIDEDDFNYQNNSQFNQFRNNSMGYNQGRPSQGSVGFNNFDSNMMENYNYSSFNQNNHFIRPASFSQQSTNSSNSNNAPNFNYSRMSSFSNSDAATAYNDQTMYNRTSFGSNFSNQANNSNNMRQNSTGFIPDYNNTATSDNTITDPLIQANMLNFDLSKSPPMPSGAVFPPVNDALDSRKASTASSTSTHSVSTNGNPPLSSTSRRQSKSSNTEKRNSIGKDTVLKSEEGLLKSNIAKPTPLKKESPSTESKKTSLAGSKATQNKEVSSGASEITAPSIQISMKKQDNLVAKIKGNGLLINEKTNKQEVSKEFQALYDQVGQNYFAEDAVFQFVNSLKAKLKKDYLNNINGNNKFNKFMKYLFSCNDQFMSEQMNSSTNVLKDTSPFTSSQGKNLCLVALKNGKLELLSVSKHFTNSQTLKPKNLVIIDGDRGIDLAMVVEPYMSFVLSLLVNFLKKKIHFDSLITDPKRHHPNKDFIDALLERHTHVLGTKPLSKIIDTKLYDLQELTQLIIPSKQVVRFASPKDCTGSLLQKLQEELKALNFALGKLESYNTDVDGQESKKNKLNIKILNSEYQFDKKKLTFYYICKERNDYRELIKELFRFYKTRIWLCAIPNNLGILEKGEWFSGSEKSLIKGSGEGKKKNIVNFDEVVLDQFQIAVYIELLNQLF